MNNRYKESDYRREAARVRNTILVCYNFHSELAAEPPSCIKERFLRAMEQESARQQRRNTIRSIAAAIAVVLLLSGFLLVTNAEARTRMITWLKSITNRSTIYEIDGSAGVADLSTYRLRNVPDGFYLTDSLYTEMNVVEYYTIENGVDGILFQCHSGEAASAVILQGDDTPQVAEQVQIHGFSGDFYPADAKSNLNNLIWFDEEKGIVFMLDSTLGKETMLRIAESIYE